MHHVMLQSPVGLQLECKVPEASHTHLSTSDTQSNDQFAKSVSELLHQPEYRMPHRACYIGDAPNLCDVGENLTLCALCVLSPRPLLQGYIWPLLLCH